jgi:hypothetical protein
MTLFIQIKTQTSSMKKLIHVFIISAIFLSCKKDAAPLSDTSSPYLRTVLSRMRDSLSVDDFGHLDTTKAYLTDSETKGPRTLRLPFIGKSISKDFLLLQTDGDGNILRGRVVHLNGSTDNTSQFSGFIRMNSLSGQILLESTVSKGYIDALHPGRGIGNQIKNVDSKIITVLPAPDADWLPEVVVIGYGSGAPPSNYISLDGLMGTSASDILNSGGGGGSDAGGANPGGGGAAGGVNTNDAPTDNAGSYSPLDPAQNSGISPLGRGVFIANGLQLEREYIYSIPIIDVRKFFNCFDQIPDAGASFSVQLCVDVPINNNPAASSNTSGFNAGHSFLVVTKSGGGISITQSFGYYPASMLSVINPFASVGSAIKDNAGQEINGRLTMSVSADQFNKLKSVAISLSTKPYVLDSSNCTDYALGVFNSARSSPIVIQPYVIHESGVIVSGSAISPGFNVTIPNSPQQLFEKLSQMKTTGNP